MDFKGVMSEPYNFDTDLDRYSKAYIDQYNYTFKTILKNRQNFKKYLELDLKLNLKWIFIKIGFNRLFEKNPWEILNVLK